MVEYAVLVGVFVTVCALTLDTHQVRAACDDVRTALTSLASPALQAVPPSAEDARQGELKAEDASASAPPAPHQAGRGQAPRTAERNDPGADAHPLHLSAAPPDPRRLQH